MSDRFNHLLPIALMLLLGIMTLWMLLVIQAPLPAGAEPNRHDPDSIAENVNIARMDEHGYPQYHLSAQRMLHYPENDSMDLVAPRFTRKDESAVLTVIADKGVIKQELKEAFFYDNVELLRQPHAGSDRLQIRTQYMQVFMDQEIARTDRAVSIVNGASTLSGTGMEYQRKSGRLNLHSSVKGSFHVQKK